MTRIDHYLVYLLGIVFLVSCSNAETKTAKETVKAAVEVIQVRIQPKEEIYNLLGTVEANRETKVSFKIGGKIKRLGFEEGQYVKKGKLLAELDTIELLARQEQSIEKKNKAKRDLERMEKLYKKRIVSLASFQDARSVFISAQAELKIVQDRLGNCAIRAPFSGRITKKLSEVGEIVSPANPIGILTEMNPILVKAAVPDTVINTIRSAQTAQIRVDSYPQEIFNGVIQRLEMTADPLSRTFGMKIRLANSHEKLRPGLIARVKVRCGKRDTGIFIPLDAIIGFGSRHAVFIVKEGVAKRRRINTGAITGDHVEVFAGLIPDENLVVSGQEYLTDGQKVMIDRKAVKVQ